MSYGRIVWRELLSNDAETVADFYARLFGWEVEQQRAEWEYRLLCKEPSGRVHPVASVTQLPDNEQTRPSLWMVYVRVGDDDRAVDDVFRRAERGGLRFLGGRAKADDGSYVFHMLDHGSSALTVPLAHRRVPEAKEPMVFGCFHWHQLSLREGQFDALSKNLGTVFDWTLRPDARDEGRGTVHFGDAREPVAGWQVMAADSGVPDHWLPFVCVEELAPVVERARELVAERGGTVRIADGTRSDRHGDRFAVIGDPTGGVVGVRGWSAVN